MCFINDCKDANTYTGADWGPKLKLCQAHYTAIVNRLTENGTITIPPHLLSDYVGLKAMMLEMTVVMDQIKVLAGEIDLAIATHQTTPTDVDDRFRAKNDHDLNYIRMSRVLENYEGYCWFPACHRVFVGGLSVPDFYWYLRHGYMAKDPGPNIEHGDFTHRFQWHAISRYITRNFSNAAPPWGWNHTPLALYTSMGEGEAATAGIWGKVLDRDGASKADVVNYKTFSEPNTFHGALHNGPYRKLTETTNRRYQKRLTAVQTAEEQIDSWKKKNGTRWNQWLLESTEPMASELAGILYAWRKNGGAPLGINTATSKLDPQKTGENSRAFADRQIAWRGHMRIVHAVEIVEDITGKRINSGQNETLAFKPGVPHYEFIITPDKAGNVVLAELVNDKQVQVVSSTEIRQRVNSSFGGFDTGHYQYGNNGVRKLAVTTFDSL